MFDKNVMHLVCSQIAKLRGSPEVLAACPVSELRELNEAIEGSSASVRRALVTAEASFL